MRGKNAEAKSRPMLYKIFIPLFIVLLLQNGVFLLCILKGGVVDRLNESAYDILAQSVMNRANELETKMNINWSNVEMAVDNINSLYAATFEGAEPVLGEAESDLQKEFFINAQPYMIETMRRNNVNGVFVILNGSDGLEEPKDGKEINKAGLSLRDMDQKAIAKDKSDISVERGSASVVNEIGYSLDSWWKPYYTFSEGDCNDFYFKPLKAALENPGTSYKDLGYWCRQHRISKNDAEVISYTVPLMDTKGRPYGVLGIEITTSFISSNLPSSELGEGGAGAYILTSLENHDSEYGDFLKELGKDEPSENKSRKYTLNTSVYNGFAYKKLIGAKNSFEVMPIAGIDNLFAVQDVVNNIDTAAIVEPVNVYSRNTPFVSEGFMLVGIMESDDILGVARSIINSIIFILGISLLLAAAGIFIAGKSFTKPITELAGRVRKMKPGKDFDLGRLGINEIDGLINSIEYMSKSVAENDDKISTIIRMTGMPMGAFEIDDASGKVFLSDSFFDVMGDVFNDERQSLYSVKGFRRRMGELDDYFVGEETETNKDGVIRLQNSNGTLKWIKIKSIKQDKKMLGIVSDTTEDYREKIKIEYERDHDQLTGIYNRRAFYNMLEKLFENTESLKSGAMIMLDLDNLKEVNDTYGHDYGDKYLRSAAAAISNVDEKKVLVARISGDEFAIFIYGRNSKDDTMRVINKLKKILSNSFMELPDRKFRLRASGGIAWYPQNSTDPRELIKFSDFAMYEIKKSIKGEFQEFDLDKYNKESYLVKYAGELNRIIDEGYMDYYMQPIIDIEEKKIFAYEALMRPKNSVIKTPIKVLNLAREQGKLYHVEKITWEKTLNKFEKCLNDFDDEVKLFINSVPNQVLSKEDYNEIYTGHKDILNRVVLEITEEDRLEVSAFDKLKLISSWGVGIAIDDYGSGYNGQTLLLDINPDFVKIDREIVKNIDADLNRQEVVTSLIAYTATRNIKVIGEGVETIGELKFLKDVGVRYVQGYLLAMPNNEFLELSEEAKELLNGL